MRELAGWLQTLPRPELDQLLAARPDARPYQDHEISQLARWLTHPTSVAGAVQRLDLFGLQLLQRVEHPADVVEPEASRAQVAGLLPEPRHPGLGRQPSPHQLVDRVADPSTALAPELLDGCGHVARHDCSVGPGRHR